MNEQQFVQALLAQFSRGEGLNLITDPRESDSPVTSGGRRLYDLIDEAFSRLDIEQLVEDVGIDEIREKYPEFADLIEKTREDIDLTHERDTEVVAEEIEEEIPKPELPEEEPENGIVSDVMARMFENKHHKKLDRPYEESIYVPRAKEEDISTDFEENSIHTSVSPEEQKEELSRIGVGDSQRRNYLEEESTQEKRLTESDRELVAGHTEKASERQLPESLFESKRTTVGLDHSIQAEEREAVAKEPEREKLNAAVGKKEGGSYKAPFDENGKNENNSVSQKEHQNRQNVIQDSIEVTGETKRIRPEKRDLTYGDYHDRKDKNDENEEYHKTREAKGGYDDYVVRRQKMDSALETVTGKKEDADASPTLPEEGPFKSKQISDISHSKYERTDSTSSKYISDKTEPALSQSQEGTYREPERLPSLEGNRISADETSNVVHSKYETGSAASGKKDNSKLGALTAAAAIPAMAAQKIANVFQKDDESKEPASSEYTSGIERPEADSYSNQHKEHLADGNVEKARESSQSTGGDFEKNIEANIDDVEYDIIKDGKDIPDSMGPGIDPVWNQAKEVQSVASTEIDKAVQGAGAALEGSHESTRMNIGITGVRTGGTVRVTIDGKVKVFPINSDNTITMNGSHIRFYDSGEGKVFVGWKGVEIQDGKANIGGTEYALTGDGSISYAGNIFRGYADTSQSYISDTFSKIADTNYFTPDFTKTGSVNLGLRGTRDGNIVTLSINGEERKIIVRSDGTASLNGVHVHVFDEGEGNVFVGWKNAAYKDGQVSIDGKSVAFSNDGQAIVLSGISFEPVFSKPASEKASSGEKVGKQPSDTFHGKRPSDTFQISVAKSIDFDPVTEKNYDDFFRKENGTYAFKDFTHKYSGKKIENIVRNAGICEILGKQGKLLRKEFSKEYLQKLHDVSWSQKTVDIMVENYDRILAVNGDTRVMAFYRAKLRKKWVDGDLIQELNLAKYNVMSLDITTNPAKLSKMLKENRFTESQKQAVQTYLSLVYKSREQVIREGILGYRDKSRRGKVELGFFHAAMPIVLKEHNLPTDLRELKKILKKETALRATADANLTDEQFELAKNFLALQKSRKRYQAAMARKRAMKQGVRDIIRFAKYCIRRYMGENYNVQGALLSLGVSKTAVRMIKTIWKTPRRMIKTGIKAGRMFDASIRMAKTAGRTARTTYQAGKAAFHAGAVAKRFIYNYGTKAAGKAAVRGVKKASVRLGRRMANMSFRTIRQNVKIAAKAAIKSVLVIMKSVITAIGSIIAGVVSPVVIILIVILVIVFIIYAYISFDSGEVYYDAGDASHDQVIQQCVDVLAECHATFREQLQVLYGGSSGNPTLPGSGSATGSYEDGRNFASGTDSFFGAPQLRQGDSVPVNRVYGTHAGCWWNYEMSWKAWNPVSSSNQRALVNYLNSHHTVSRSKAGENYAMVDQKYFLAASTLYWGNVGDILKIEFDGNYNINGENTNTLYIIIADIKSYSHTGYPADPLGLYGHPLGGNRDLAEFFSYDPLSNNSSINLNNKMGNPVTVTNMGNIMSGASAGGSVSQVMKENPILEVLRGYQQQLESDLAQGIKWTYSNHNTAQTFRGAISGNNRKVNCALLARWALRDAGLISNDTFFYGGGDGEIRWRNNGSKEAVESVCDIISVKGRTINELISSGTLQAGDIVTFNHMQHTNIYAGDNKWFDAGHAYATGAGEGAVFRSWFGDGVYGSSEAAYIIRVKGQYFSNSLGGRNIQADIVYLQDIDQDAYRSLLNPQKNIYILNPEEITDLPDGISPTPTPTPTPVPAYKEGDTVTIDGEQYEVKDQEFADASGTVAFYNNNQEIISMVIAMFDFDISISTDLKETIYTLKDAKNSEEAKSSFEEGVTNKITDDTWRLISYLEAHGLDMTDYKEGGYDALMDSVIVALFNATHVVTDTTVTEYHDGMMYEVPIMDPEGGYLIDEDGEYVYQTIVVPCPGHSKKSAAVTTIFFDDIFDLKTWWNKKIYSKDAFKKENPNYEEKKHVLKRNFQVINKPDVDKRIGGYCYGIPSYSNNSFENVEITDAEARQNMQKIYDFAISPSGLRLSEECAVGLLANIYAESRFNPQAVETATGEGYGIIQWSFERKPQLRAWCSANGYNYRTLDGQLAFLKYEFDTGSGWVASVSGFRSCSTAEEAAEYFCRYNEQPGQIEKTVAERREYASQIWDKIQSGESS